MKTATPVVPAEAESFAGLGLSDRLVLTLSEVGYETPTPIQRQTIPHLLAGRDLVGQAQTGTGKTAAFSLPLLDRLDLERRNVQAIVLTPTRELAIQVAEAIHRYGRRLGQVQVLPVYGGDSIQKQIRRLESGVQVIVGTPGRVMDHLRRGTLSLATVRLAVLDEADEMLKMGFQEDIEWILKHAPVERQTALFSATMPREVRRIAERYLRDPVNVEIHHATVTVPTVEQRYINVPERQKLDVLTHLLEAEAVPGQAILIFVRTKIGAADLVEKLQARGYAAEPMHGDMNQAQREIIIRRMREEQVEMVVATDVAARGLDVENIGHVINYDIPNDPESYVHRIGRTARAGRKGSAILFVTPREGRMLREIERFTGQRLTSARLPSRADVTARRVALFKEKILAALSDDDLPFYQTLVESLVAESGREPIEIAAAAARLARGGKPLVATLEPESALAAPRTDAGMLRLHMDAGRDAGVRPADVVGALASEANIPGKLIGAIDVYEGFTLVDLPAATAEALLAAGGMVTVRGRPVALRRATTLDGVPRRLRADGRPAPGRGGSFRDAKGRGARPSGESESPARRASTGMARHKVDGPKGEGYRGPSGGSFKRRKVDRSRQSS